MTDYVKTTNFADKDSTGAIVTGADFELEFSNVATHVATKADKASPTLTGAVQFTNTLNGITTTEFGHLDNVSSNIQTQLNAKAPKDAPAITGAATFSGTLNGITTIEFGHLDGASENIQTKLTSLQTQVDGLGGGHARQHAITSTEDHTAGNWKVFYSNGSNAIVELPLGASGTVLTSGGATAAPTFAAAGGYTLDADLTTLENPNTLGDLTTTTLALTDGFIVYDASSSNGSWYKKVTLQNLKTIGPTVNTTSTKTLALSDAGSFYYNSGATTHTLTVPPNSSVAFPTGTEIGFGTGSSGKITLAQGSGVTITSLNNYKTVKASGGGAYLIKVATDTWLLAGDLEAV